MSNVKISDWERMGVKFKRFFGWSIKDLSQRYGVTKRTIYRTLKK